MTSTSYSLVAVFLLCVSTSDGTSIAAPYASGASFPSGGEAALIQPEKLDALMAPIALYPDALVMQILQCSSAPDQIKRLNDWIKKNPGVKGAPAQDAATAEGFEPNFVAIVLFPTVVQMMVEKPDWTRDLAKAFADDRSGVFASIQRLRKQAQDIGNLTTNEQQQVQNVTVESGQQVIVIQPANPQIVYVPTYNPTIVYTQPPPPDQTATAALVGFTAGIIIGAAIADDDCGWGYRGSCLCDEGYEEYTEHRENMAAQRGENQSNRQQSRTDKQSGRQDTRSENQTGRQEGHSENQANRQESRGSGSSASGQSAGSQQAGRGAANEARGSAQGGSAPSQRSGTSSSAMSGYQNGSAEKASSARGRGSMSGKSGGGASGRSSGGSRGGGGGGGGRGR